MLAPAPDQTDAVGPVESSRPAAPGADPSSLPHPPGPANVLRWTGLTFRHAIAFRAAPLGFSTRIAHRYGDLTSFLLFTKRAYLVNHPDLIHEYLVRRREEFIRAPWQMRVLSQVVGDGLLTSEGDLWLRQRRLLQQAFRGAAMPRYAELTAAVTRERIAAWRSDEPVDLVAEMAALAMDLSIRTTTGLNPAELGGPSPAEFSTAIVDGANLLNHEMENPVTPPDWAPLPSRRRKRRTIETINAYVQRAIELRRSEPDRHHDLLGVLLRAIDVEGDGRGISDRLARDEAVTILLAGNHASSAVLGWLWKLVLARPEVLEQLVAETDRILGARDATLADVPRLEYTKQVIQETLRLYPAAWVLFGRQAARETSLGGYRVRRGGWVFAYPFVTQRDPRFFPDPLRFDPTRFAQERVDDIPKGAYLPFGHGPRVCIGQQLAMTQLTLIVATVLQRVSLEPQPGFDEMTIRREFAIRPKSACRVLANRRDAWRPPRKPR